MARGSPRSCTASNWLRIIAVRMPFRRCVGRTETQVTPAVGRMPPGTVVSNDQMPAVPTTWSPSQTDVERSYSRISGPVSFSKRSGRKSQPKLDAFALKNGSSSSGVIGRMG